ncbi:hypothetical protein INR49_011267 [Caranx melampygus]|nr:hypothetical protein INR49_011267 [Caranx melampygus]
MEDCEWKDLTWREWDTFMRGALQGAEHFLFDLLELNSIERLSEMDGSGVTQTPEEVGMVCSDSAYGSSVVDTDTEDGQTPTSNTFPYNEDLTHKTILVGDSGVGKTSLLVQYDQGNFIPGSFTATVGIGFTKYSIYFLLSRGSALAIAVWPHAVAYYASRAAGGCRRLGLRGGHLSDEPCASFLDTSRRQLRCGSAALHTFLGTAMSTDRKTSLTDKQTKNGTSKYVLERCASINEYYDIAFKVMLLGDSAVGKTCVLVRFKDGAFLGGNFIATVGIDFRVREMLLSRLTHRLIHNMFHYFCMSQ